MKPPVGDDRQRATPVRLTPRDQGAALVYSITRGAAAITEIFPRL